VVCYNVQKSYGPREVLRGIDLTVNRGEVVVIMGPSGSGKSTLMNILGLLDVPTRGAYRLDGVDVGRLSDRLARVRNRKIGFVFQQFNLLPRTPAIEQVELPLVYAGAAHPERRSLAALEAVGLRSWARHKPSELSGGQQQRVAIARALVNNPSLILADEPTGQLDTRTSLENMEIFQRLNLQWGITVVFVSHEPDIAQHTRRIVRMRDGRIVADEAVALELVRDAAQELASLPPEEPDEEPDVTRPQAGKQRVEAVA
jgi:putative ABC transport system ATP-binding protein